MKCISLGAIGLALIFAGAVFSQDPPTPPKMMDPNAKPEFEVASIKPSDPNQTAWGISMNTSGMLLTEGTTLNDLVKFAYGVHSKQVIGAPGWADSEKFDIQAKPDIPGMPTMNQMKAMLQRLLGDRFSLASHKGRRELAVYAITVAKSGVKIQKEENATLPLPAFSGRPQVGTNVYNATLAEYASVTQSIMDLPVVDQTGLGDTRYTFVIKFTPDPGMRPVGSAPAAPSNMADPDAPPNLFRAMEQQLGLRMQKAKAAVDVMIIDKVERPSPN